MSETIDHLPVVNNEAEKRFEIDINGQVAILEYIRTATNITYTHTEVPEQLEGMGLGAKLAKHALDFAEEVGLKVIPLCPFVKGYIQRHPEYMDNVFGYRRPS